MNNRTAYDALKATEFSNTNEYGMPTCPKCTWTVVHAPDCSLEAALEDIWQNKYTP